MRSRERIVWSKLTGRAVKHGIASGYTVHGCRCDECYEARETSPGREREKQIRRAASDKANQ